MKKYLANTGQAGYSGRASINPCFSPLRGMGEKPLLLGEDFSRNAVPYKTTARHLTQFATSSSTR